MSKVHLLPSDVISRIAAGEVIERPASVVKELLENSLDAGADSVEIHLEEAGKKMIHIKDNGSGIEKEDMEKIFLRHATSKIENFADLDSIKSLGFRGEALYSIAAISDITLTSKIDKQDAGWEIHLRGSKQLGLKPASMQHGTEIKVQELFFNTPARRKFLKANSTELNQILSIVIPYALLKPKSRFLVTHRGRALLDLNPASSTKVRIADALNIDGEHLIEAGHYFEDKGISIRMILGNINIKRSQRDQQFIFVNGRPVQSKSIGFLMNQTYQLIFPPKTYPFFAVFVEMPQEELDVNIHPTKREIKIKNEHTLSSIIRSMCEQALMEHGQARKVTSPMAQDTNETDIDKVITGAHTTTITLETSVPAGIFKMPRKEIVEDKPVIGKEMNVHSAEVQPAFFEEQSQDLRSQLSSSRYIGSFMKKFQLFEYGKSMLVVDQHAAQERIVFEKFKGQIEEGTIEVQQLLSPILVKLSPQEIVSFDEAKDTLNKLGLESTMFDEETLAIQTYPVLIKDPEIAVRSLLSGENIEKCDTDTIARRACRKSVMAGDFLSKEQAVFQREQLVKCKDPFTCPHGRPTVVEMSEGFLDKQFLRT